MSIVLAIYIGPPISLEIRRELTDISIESYTTPFFLAAYKPPTYLL